MTTFKLAGDGGPNISTQDIASGNFSGATIDARSLSHFLAGALLVQNPQHLLLGNYLLSLFTLILTSIKIITHTAPPLTRPAGLKNEASAVVILLHNDATVTMCLPLRSSDME